MARPSDHIIDRKHLKSQISLWRGLALLGVFAFCALISWEYFTAGGLSTAVRQDYVAKISVNGIIIDDPKRDALFERVLKDENAKALIVSLDTPGGTTVGGEELYLNLRKVSEKKPVIALMRTLCASAGYMAALGADYIVAREGSITGSIGVIMQSVEISELAKKLGIAPITITSGEFKDSPSMFRPMNDREKATITSVIMDAHRHFRDLVAKRRGFDEAAMSQIADGRVFTGRQALDAKLIDGIGGEAEARAWLASEKGLDEDIRIEELKPQREFESLFAEMKSALGIADLQSHILPLDGLVSIWHPSLNNVSP